jgi:hypothetical protein
VLDIAPLIMVTLPMVSSFSSTCGCFLRGGRSPSGDLPPLSLPLVDGLLVRVALLSANGGASRALELKILRVQERGGGGGEPTPGVGQASRLRPTSLGPSRPGSSPLHSRGSSGDYAFCPFHLHDFDDVILASKMEVLHA